MVVRRYALEAPNEACSLRLLRGFLTPLLVDSCGPDESAKQAADRLVLAIDEACANQVRHRCSTIDDGALRLEVFIEDRMAEMDAKECRLELRLQRFCRMDQADAIRDRILALRPDLPVILSSGYHGSEIASQTGDDAPFIQKPYRRRDLARVIEKATTVLI